MNSDIILLSKVAAAVIIAASLIVTSAYNIETYGCADYGSVTGQETKYTLTNGCFVKVNEKWYLKYQIRTD